MNKFSERILREMASMNRTVCAKEMKSLTQKKKKKRQDSNNFNQLFNN